MLCLFNAIIFIEKKNVGSEPGRQQFSADWPGQWCEREKREKKWPTLYNLTKHVHSLTLTPQTGTVTKYDYSRRRYSKKIGQLLDLNQHFINNLSIFNMFK